MSTERKIYWIETTKAEWTQRQLLSTPSNSERFASATEAMKRAQYLSRFGMDHPDFGPDYVPAIPEGNTLTVRQIRERERVSVFAISYDANGKAPVSPFGSLSQFLLRLATDEFRPEQFGWLRRCGTVETIAVYSAGMSL